MNISYEVNTKLSLFNYLAIVTEIANGFINEDDGTYQPQIGKLNSMRIFYNCCVIKGNFDKKYGHDVSDVDAMAEIIDDEDFIMEYNKAINFNGEIKYNFANAYRDALEIVNVNKAYISSAFDMICKRINKYIKDISPLFTEDNISLLNDLFREKIDTSQIVADPQCHGSVK